MDECWFYSDGWIKAALIEKQNEESVITYNDRLMRVRNDLILPRNKIHDIDNLKKMYSFKLTQYH